MASKKNEDDKTQKTDESSEAIENQPPVPDGDELPIPTELQE